MCQQRIVCTHLFMLLPSAEMLLVLYFLKNKKRYTIGSILCLSLFVMLFHHLHLITLSLWSNVSCLALNECPCRYYCLITLLWTSIEPNGSQSLGNGTSVEDFLDCQNNAIMMNFSSNLVLYTETTTDQCYLKMLLRDPERCRWCRSVFLCHS